MESHCNIAGQVFLRELSYLHQEELQHKIFSSDRWFSKTIFHEKSSAVMSEWATDVVRKIDKSAKRALT